MEIGMLDESGACRCPEHAALALGATVDGRLGRWLASRAGRPARWW
jgi:hypothetical protein